MLKITDNRVLSVLPTVRSSEIANGTIFTGSVSGVASVWYKTPRTLVNLQQAELSFTKDYNNYDYQVQNYKEVEKAELILLW